MRFFPAVGCRSLDAVNPPPPLFSVKPLPADTVGASIPCSLRCSWRPCTPLPLPPSSHLFPSLHPLLAPLRLFFPLNGLFRITSENFNLSQSQRLPTAPYDSSTMNKAASVFTLTTPL
jgi:hypothetical protein